MTVNEGLFVSRVNFLNTLSNYIRFDEITISKFFLKFIAFFLLTIVLSGCAGKRAFNAGNSLLDDGKPVEGLAKLEEAIQLEPGNAQYRIALYSRRNSLVNRLISSGDIYRRDGKLTEAENAYRQAQVYDANNKMAQQGLDALAMEQRHRKLLVEAEILFKKSGNLSLNAALENLRTILSENPNQKEALKLKSKINDERVKELTPESKLAAIYGKPITLEFRDAPLKSVFDLIAKTSGLNFFFDKDMQQGTNTTILAKNVSIEDAVRLILITNQLEQKVLNENSILIYPNIPQKLKDYQTLTVRTFYLTNADVKAVSNTIKTIVKTKDMVIDERLGLIIMRDTPEAIRMAERIVALQDLSDPEVMLEVEVLEVQRSRLQELGIRLPDQLTLSPLSNGTTPLTLDQLGNLNRSTIQATIGNVVINAHEDDQQSNILANPRIRVRNKEKAKIMIGDRLPVFTTNSTTTGFVSESISYIDVGLKLEVEPNIYLDDEVAIKVNLEVSTLVNQIISKSGSLAYQIGTRGANTLLRLKDGETQVLAGLISDQDRSTANRVPGLGELPMLGRLFGSQQDNTQRSEILLSITPRIVRTIHREDLQSAEFESGTESSIGSRSLRLANVEPTSGMKLASTAATSGSFAEPLATSITPGLDLPVGIPDVAMVQQSSQNTTPPDVTVSVPVDSQKVTASTKTQPTSATVSLLWKAPAQTKVGDKFSAVLRVESKDSLTSLPMLITFDPKVLQVASVEEGDFFKSEGEKIQFSYRVDAEQGKIFIANIHNESAGVATGNKGAGSLVTVMFKSLKADDSTKIQLLSATPVPPAAEPILMPIDHVIKVLK